MKHRYPITIKIAAAAVAIVSTALTALWSWNTLADLYGWPATQFRHVLAAFLLLAILRFAIRGGNHRHGYRRNRQRT